MTRKSTRVFDFIYNQQSYCPVNKCLNQKKDGKWVSLPIKKFVEKVNTLSRAILKFGVQPGDNIISLISKNSIEWGIVDTACMQIGVRNVTLSSSDPAKYTKSAFEEIDPKLCFVCGNEAYEKLKEFDKTLTEDQIFSFEDNSHIISWLHLLQSGVNTENQTTVEKLRANIKPTDIATIVYTSGTTGMPKGVVLSHRNVVENVKAMDKSLCIEKFEQNKAISYLPASSMSEKMAIYYYQYKRYEVYFVSNENSLAEEIKEVCPHMMNTVTRYVENIYGDILYEISEMKGAKKAYYGWALQLAKKYNSSSRKFLINRIKLAIADNFVYKKWRKMLGGEMKFLLSFGSKMNSEIVRVFNASKIPLIQSYGTTESAMMISFNDIRSKKYKVQSVGKPLCNTDIRIEEDGEIIVKSPGVMMGYYKNPDLTSKVIKNGYYHTGDYGKIDRDGYLTVLGRKKRVAKTANKNLVSPMRIEKVVKKSPFIQEVAVFCRDFNSPVAMIQPNFKFLEKWIKDNGLEYNLQYNYLNNYEIQSLFEEEINKINQYSLQSYEQISNYELSPFEWTVKNGILTSTMIVKHDAIKETSIKLFGSCFKKTKIETQKKEETIARNLFEKLVTIDELEEVEEVTGV